MGGVFLAFSTFVMPALGRVEPSVGVKAMQAINKAAPTPLFMVPLFGTTVLGLVLGGRAIAHLDEPGAKLEVAGAVLYLGAIVLTAAYHVPKNDALAVLDPNGPGIAAAWSSYRGAWTTANHFRALLCLGAATSWVVALVRIAAR